MIRMKVWQASMSRCMRYFYRILNSNVSVKNADGSICILILQRECICWILGMKYPATPHASILLTHWGRATHKCVGKLTIIGSDNGLPPGRRQAFIWTIAGTLLIGPLETNFSEMLIEIQTVSFKKMHLKLSSAKWRSFCLGLDVLMVLCMTPQSHRDSPEGAFCVIA